MRNTFKFLLFTSSLTGAAVILSVGAALAQEEGQQVSAVLGGQTAQMTVNDPAIMRAIEMLIKKQIKPSESQKQLNKQDNPIGTTPNSLRNKNLILGGPEVFPM